MNKTLYIFLMVATSLLAACTADDVDDVKFGVAIRNNPEKIYVGDEVTFDFYGDADYVVFWSGEFEHKYANRNRLTATPTSMKLTYGIYQNYGRPQTNDVMSIFISEDFNGDYTPQGIEEATWTELTETEDGQWWTPVETQNPAKECWGDLSGYVEKEFVLAFRYKTPPGLTEGVQHPTVTINPISLDKTLDGQVLSKSNPKQDLGFQHVVVAGDAGNPRLDASAIGFQPSQTPLQTNVEIWCISGRQKPNEVAPDSGEPIRSLSMPIKSYTYTFSQPGTYTVTFEAHNANAWNAKEALCEFEIDVKHR